MRFARYVGTPYRDRGRALEVGPGSPGVDCWGLVVAFYRDELGLELPDYSGAYASAAEIDEVDRTIRGGLAAWRRVASPEPGDAVLFWLTDPARPTHVGVYAGEGRFLHVRAGAPRRGQRAGTCIGATIESLRAGLWSTRVAGFFRHESRFPTWRLHALPLPWSLRPVDLDVPVGTSFAEALERAGLVRAPGGAVRVLHGDREVPELADWNGRAVEVWRHLRPRAGDLVVVRSLPQDPVTLTAFLVAAGSALSTLGTAAASLVPFGGAIAAAAGSAAGSAAFGTFLIGGAALIEGLVTFAVGAAIAGGVFAASSALTGLSARAESGGGGSIGPGASPAANGVGNELRPDDVVPSGFGRFKAYPPLGAPPYTEVIDGERFWRVLLVVGKGRYRLRDPETGRPRIFLADAPVDEIDGVRFEIREGGVVTGPGGSWVNRYAAEILDDGPNGTRPAHYWRLGDAPASPTAADSAGAVALAATDVAFGAAALVATESDQAATFNGTSSRLAAGSALATGARWTWEGWAAPASFSAGRRCLVAAGRTGAATDPDASGVALYQDGRDLELEVRTLRRRRSGSGPDVYGVSVRRYTGALGPGVSYVSLYVATEPAGPGVSRAVFFPIVNGTALTVHRVGYSEATERAPLPLAPGSIGGRPIPGAGSGTAPASPYTEPYYINPRDQFSVGAVQDTGGAWSAFYAGELDELALYLVGVPIEERRAHYALGSGQAEAEGDPTRGARFSIYADSPFETQVNQTLPPAPPDEPSGTRSAPIIRKLGGTEATELGVTVEFPAGLFRVNEEGKDKEAQVGIELRFRRADDPDGWRHAPDVEGFVRTIGRAVGVRLKPTAQGTIVELSGKTRNRFLAEFRWPAEPGSYFASVVRVETDGGGNRGGSDTGGFASTFQVLSMRSVEFGVAPLRLEGLCTVALFMPLDAVGSVVGRVSVIGERMLRVYDPTDPEADGAGWTPYRVTRNAADAALAVLTDPDVTPEPIADDELELDSFVALRSRAEDFDLYVDFASNVRDLANLALASSWASLDDAGDGSIAVVEDRPGLTADAVISPATARNFRGVKRFPELPHAIRVGYWNEDGERDELVVYDDGFSERGEEPGKPDTVGTVAASRFEVVTLRGLVDRERVRRYYRKRLVGNRLRSEEWACEVWLDHLAYKRGSVVDFTHPTALVGDKWGRVVDVELDGSGDLVAFTIDQEWTLEAGTDYGARFHTIDETAPAIAVRIADLAHPGTAPTRRFELEGAPLAGDPLPGPGDHVAIGKRGEETFAALVREIRPRDDMAADVVLFPYAPQLHDAGDGPVPFEPPLTRPRPRPEREGPAQPRIAGVESDARYLLRTTTGLVTRARVRVVSPLSAYGQPVAVRARARTVTPAGPWIEGAWADLGGGEAFVEGLVDGELYEFQAATQTRVGLTSTWSIPVRHRVVGKLEPPPAPPELRLEGGVLRWSYPFADVLDLDGFEVRYRIGNAHPLAWQGARKAHDGRIGGTEFAVAELPRGFGLTVYVVAFDLLNLASAPAALLLEQGDRPANVLRVIDEAADGWPGETVGGAPSGGALVAYPVGATQTGTATLDGSGRVATVAGFGVELVRVGDFFFFDADGLEAASRIVALDPGAGTLELAEPYEGASSSGACTVEPSAWGVDDAAPAWDGDDAVAAWGLRSAELVYTARTYRPDPLIETGRELRLVAVHTPATAQLELDYRELGPGPAWGPDDSAPAWGPDDAAPAWGPDGGWSPWRPWPGHLLPLRTPYEFRARVLEDRKATTTLEGFAIVVDVEDRQVRLEDLVVGAAGLRLPLPEPFREIKGIRWTLQKVPGDTATGLVVVDYRIDGPLVETLPAGARGTFDVVVEGY